MWPLLHICPCCSQCQAVRFRDYAELTILKVLDAHRTDAKEVLHAADACCVTLATHLPPHMCLHTLNPIVKSAEPPILLPAVKMTTRVLEQLSETEVLSIVADMIDGLLRAFDHNESSVRKAAVQCLVAINNVAGDEALTPYTAHLPNAKVGIPQARTETDFCTVETTHAIHQARDGVEQQRHVADLTNEINVIFD